MANTTTSGKQIRVNETQRLLIMGWPPPRHRGKDMCPNEAQGLLTMAWPPPHHQGKQACVNEAPALRRIIIHLTSEVHSTPLFAWQSWRTKPKVCLSWHGHHITIGVRESQVCLGVKEPQSLLIMGWHHAQILGRRSGA